jgi:uncharacterized protein (UPF0332 family)
VTPQSAAFLEKARRFLLKAQDFLDAHHWPDEVGRAAYLAGFHAAQAFLFERTGKMFKSHKGVQSEFSRLTKDDPRFTPDQRAFLPQTYNLKALADYETGPGAEVTAERAASALEAAKKFIAHVAALLPANGRTPPAPVSKL